MRKIALICRAFVSVTEWRCDPEMKKLQTTASYRVKADEKGNRYCFFCDLSGAALCTTEPVRADTPEEELFTAWEQEGRKHFNRCQKCGRWVSDVMFNADVLTCVDCTPWEEPPQFCWKCGEAVSPEHTFCHKCGARLQYGEVT